MRSLCMGYDNFPTSASLWAIFIQFALYVTTTDEEIRGKAVTVPETPPVGSLKSKIEALGKASQRPPMETSPTHAPVSPSGGVKALKEMHAAIMEKPEDSVKAPPPRERTGMIMSAKERFEASFSSKPPSAPAPASPARKDTKNGLSTGITVVTSDAESNVDVFWERCLDRVRRKPLRLRDYDFTDLEPEDQEEPRPLSSHYPRIGVPVLPSPAPIGGAIPPPVPSAIVGGIPPPPPPSTRDNALPPPPYGLSSAGPPPPPPSLGTTSSPGTQLNLPPVPGTDLPKTKKTVKLHWTEWKPSPKDLKCIANAKQTTAGRDKLDSAVDSKGIGGRFFSSVMSRSREPKEAPKDWKKCTIWSEVVQVKLDADFLQECFENKSAEVKVKKQDVGTKKIEVLDVKRSNAINIGLKVLPPPRTISTAILKMDSSIINREGIEVSCMPSSCKHT
ncbi:unnamed protein product [Dicrocoelium dendriticum]|nr:unnamed protein product [Dicrocoelium dendriticum]